MLSTCRSTVDGLQNSGNKMRHARLFGLRSYVLLLPILALFLGFYIYPIATILIFGFVLQSGTNQLPPKLILGSAHFALRNYSVFFQSIEYRNVLVATLRMAGLSTIAALIFGYPIAYRLTRLQNKRIEKFLLSIIFVALFVGAIARNYGWLVIMLQTGPLIQFLNLIGMRNAALLNTETGVVISLTNFILPFTILSLVPSLRNIDRTIEEAALSLGATETRVFLRVTLPMSVPGIIAGVSLSFSLASSAFVTPLIIGGGVVNMLSNFVYIRFAEIFDYPLGAVISTVLLLVTLSVSYVVNGLLVRKTEAFYS